MSIQRVLAQHRLSPGTLQRHLVMALQASLPSSLPTQQLALPLEPHTLAQRLALALGPEPLVLRFLTYDEYPTEEQARWRTIELLEVGFRPRRVAKLLAIQPLMVYHDPLPTVRVPQGSVPTMRRRPPCRGPPVSARRGRV